MVLDAYSKVFICEEDSYTTGNLAEYQFLLTFLTEQGNSG